MLDWSRILPFCMKTMVMRVLMLMRMTTSPMMMMMTIATMAAIVVAGATLPVCGMHLLLDALQMLRGMVLLRAIVQVAVLSLVHGLRYRVQG